MTGLLKRKNALDFQKISILWVSYTMVQFSNFTVSSALFHILKQVVELGHDVSLMATGSSNEIRVENPQVRIISVPLKYVPIVSPVMFTIALFFFLPLYIVKSKPKFVIMEPDIYILSSLPGRFVSKFTQAKFVLDVRSTPVETAGFRGFIRKFWFSESILIAKKLFDGITIITPLMKKEICKRYGLNRSKVGVWTSGVSPSLFNPQNTISESTALKRKLGLDGKFVVFYHGVFTATRGLLETIMTIRILKHKNPTIVFFLLGTGPIVTNLKALIQKENLQDNVIIHNPVSHLEVPKFIGVSDVGIVPLPYHPYWRFQCSLKLLEYLAMEKVVILTDIPAHRTVVRDAKCGIYISSTNPMEIAKAIEYAYFNRENLEKWGKIGRDIVKEKYAWEKVARDLENYLLSLIDKVG